MIYTVVRIDEDVDYGCEEREHDAPVLAVVTLRDSDGSERIIRVPDQLLYERNIQNNDMVMIADDGTIYRA